MNTYYYKACIVNPGAKYNLQSVLSRGKAKYIFSPAPCFYGICWLFGCIIMFKLSNDFDTYIVIAHVENTLRLSRELVQITHQTSFTRQTLYYNSYTSQTILPVTDKD